MLTREISRSEEDLAKKYTMLEGTVLALRGQAPRQVRLHQKILDRAVAVPRREHRAAIHRHERRGLDHDFNRCTQQEPTGAGGAVESAMTARHESLSRRGAL